ncbi:hypothetical protein BC940DRAFT_371574 [Gongronella butleri]|nr:hypothetical protein BC940DRAFT_371574 [Gongronella butleri]
MRAVFIQAFLFYTLCNQALCATTPAKKDKAKASASPALHHTGHAKAVKASASAKVQNSAVAAATAGSWPSHVPNASDMINHQGMPQNASNIFSQAGDIARDNFDYVEDDIFTEANYHPSGTRPASAQISSCRTQGQIAVTYSEGPSDVTAKIVRHLNNFDAKANFFVNASWLYTQQYAMVVQNIYNTGHLIGMTYRVPNDDSSTLTDVEIRDDIVKNAQVVESLIGVSPKYVRLHYTPERDTRTEAILADLGYVLVGYNLDSMDYSHKEAIGPNSIEDVYRGAFVHQKDTYDAMGSFISVQYDIPDTGALNAVPFMVNAINDEGYSMVRMDGCLNDPKPYKKSATTLQYVSDKFSLEQQNYHAGQKPVPSNLLVVETEPNEEDKMFMKGDSGAATAVPSTMTVMLLATLAIVQWIL